MTTKLLAWNVNGIRAAYKKDLATILSENNFDILCLQEIKAQSDQVEELLKDHHDLIIKSSPALKKGYSGVATIVQKNLQILKTSNGLGENLFDSEGRFVITYFQDYTIYNIYFPSGTTGQLRQDFKYKFLDYVYEYFQKLPKEEFDRSIICGDFNICHQEIDIHHPKVASKLGLSGFLPDERKWLDSFLKLGFKDAFRLANGEKPDSYTWWSYRAGSRAKNLGWRIDYFLLGQKAQEKLSSCRILSETMGSDHVPVEITLK